MTVFHPADGPPAAGKGHVELRHLGNGGWLIRRGADVVATAPFVGNPINAEVYLGPRDRTPRASVAMGTDLPKFVREVHRAAGVPVDVPEPGRTVSFPVGRR